jgi:hypothetical protein
VASFAVKFLGCITSAAETKSRQSVRRSLKTASQVRCLELQADGIACEPALTRPTAGLSSGVHE